MAHCTTRGWNATTIETIVITTQNLIRLTEVDALAVVGHIVHQLFLLTYLSDIGRTAHMRGIAYQQVGYQRGHQAVASLVLQGNVHAHIFGINLITQGLDRLVVLYNLGLLHILGTDILCELVITATGEIEPFDGKALYLLVIIVYLAV